MKRSTGQLRFDPCRVIRNVRNACCTKLCESSCHRYGTSPRAGYRHRRCSESSSIPCDWCLDVFKFVSASICCGFHVGVWHETNCATISAVSYSEVSPSAVRMVRRGGVDTRGWGRVSQRFGDRSRPRVGVLRRFIVVGHSRSGCQADLVDTQTLYFEGGLNVPGREAIWCYLSLVSTGSSKIIARRAFRCGQGHANCNPRG